MSRYIEYHDICSAIGNQQDGTGITYEALAHAMVEIQLAPSIDLVRCKECKHCSKDRIKWSVKDEDGNWIDTKCNLCRRTKLEVNLDDYCSYGERSSDEQ